MLSYDDRRCEGVHPMTDHSGSNRPTGEDARPADAEASAPSSGAKKIAEAHVRLAEKQEQVGQHVEERRDSIRRGARRSDARFRP